MEKGPTRPDAPGLCVPLRGRGKDHRPRAPTLAAPRVHSPCRMASCCRYACWRSALNDAARRVAGSSAPSTAMSSVAPPPTWTFRGGPSSVLQCGNSDWLTWSRRNLVTVSCIDRTRRFVLRGKAPMQGLLHTCSSSSFRSLRLRPSLRSMRRRVSCVVGKLLLREGGSHNARIYGHDATQFPRNLRFKALFTGIAESNGRGDPARLDLGLLAKVRPYEQGIRL